MFESLDKGCTIPVVSVSTLRIRQIQLELQLIAYYVSKVKVALFQMLSMFQIVKIQLDSHFAYHLWDKMVGCSISLDFHTSNSQIQLVTIANHAWDKIVICSICFDFYTLIFSNTTDTIVYDAWAAKSPFSRHFTFYSLNSSNATVSLVNAYY